MAVVCKQLFQLTLISWIAISWGQDTSSDHVPNPVERMHSPYMPEHPQSIPFDNTDTVGQEYIEYLRGTIPLILVVPHGGKDTPKNIHDRTAGCFNGACIYKHNCGQPDTTRCPVNTAGDENSRELAMKIRDNFVNMTGHAPYVVISKLSPSKVDVDLDEATGTFEDTKAKTAWRAFHHSIQDAKNDLGNSPGLLLDLRHHLHPLARVELGYITASDDLNKDDLIADDSSVKALASRTKLSFSKLIRGDRSLGGLLEKQSVSTLPSPNYPVPNSSPYLSDSYTIRVHGSRDYGSVDAILVSSADAFTSNDVIDSYAQNLSLAVHEFLKLYYDFGIKSAASNSQLYKHKASVKAAIVCATFLGCFVILALIYVARSRIRRFRIYRYERFADEV